MRRGFCGARIALERRDEDVLLAQAHAVLEHQAHLLALGRQFVIRRQHSSVLVLGRRRLRPGAATRKTPPKLPGRTRVRTRTRLRRRRVIARAAGRGEFADDVNVRGGGGDVVRSRGA